jgi:methylthioribose-1-phosphate isomerase
MADIKPIEWRDNKLIILDQRLLPQQEVYREIGDVAGVAEAIKTLAVRGAPAIGIAAAYGIALGALGIQVADMPAFLAELRQISAVLAASRPTARNLFWAIETMTAQAEKGRSVRSTRRSLLDLALKIHREQMRRDKCLAAFGAELFAPGDTILTHCNAGALATAGFGSALGVIKQAHAQLKGVRVVATETRPLLQGARLTAFELKKAGVPFTLITDSMAGSFMHLHKIQAVVVGADRIAANGDTANKIGTYSLAVLAKENRIPFYVAAPVNTIDLSISGEGGIVIEERRPEEVTSLHGVAIAPEGIKTANPAFDVTPHKYISAIVSENGIARKPFTRTLKLLCTENKAAGDH